MRSELDALRRELQRTPRVVEEPDVAAATSVAAATTASADRSQSDVARILSDLQTQLSETMDDAESLVVAHPAASVAAAFLLGLAVGSVLMRTR